MTLSTTLLQIAKKFELHELHAAHGGREVLDAFVALVNSSDAATVRELLREVQQNIIYLLKFLPPYAPPIKNINRVLLCLERAIETDQDLPSTVRSINEISIDVPNPIQNAQLITEVLKNLISDRSIIYTHTLSETVLNSILELNQWGKVGTIYVTESRPNNDGWETARRLAASGIETVLTIDAGMPFAISQAQVMISGAEIINENGAVLGKVGAYPAAVFSKKYGNPVWILADSTKIWPRDIENLNPYLITAGDVGLKISDPTLRITGSFFDRTPPEFITGYATELGLLDQAGIKRYANQIQLSKWLEDQLSANSKRNRPVEITYDR